MQTGAMAALVTQRLNEGASPTFYPKTEIVAALNEANRFFCLLTLALEKTVLWSVPAATTFFRMLQLTTGSPPALIFPDWIVGLRITATSGAKVRPSRLDDLTSLDSQWVASPGAPVRYAQLGADLIAIYQQPAGGGTSLNVTYARAPLALVADTDVPEPPAEYHPRYVDYAINRVRQVEGGDEYAKTLPLLDEYLNAAQQYAAFVRSRNLGARYDKEPFELESFDRSALLKLRGDLPPGRKYQV